MIPISGYNQQYYISGGFNGGYDNYREDNYVNEPYYQLVNTYINKMQTNGINVVGQKVLIVGCALGYSVQHLVQSGVDCYGMDCSSYAISHAPSGISSRLITGDATIQSNYVALKAMAGLTKPNDKFALIIDEDMISCLTDPQATTFLALAKQYSNFLVHYMETGSHLSGWYNYKTLAQWKTFAGNDPKEKWYSRLSWSES